jgi:hypothetical protein
VYDQARTGRTPGVYLQASVCAFPLRKLPYERLSEIFAQCHELNIREFRHEPRSPSQAHCAAVKVCLYQRLEVNLSSGYFSKIQTDGGSFDFQRASLSSPFTNTFCITKVHSPALTQALE